ncbi:tetratricopeptide-like helical domain-containing protein [Artemisia annua]|uniref:Tetratricopeptide-like helical domain-containing protein n=1 Tax=Artemisia annua TaxID=35608 RepID=A0A2U1KFA7_ARTAN|nr:tetratricopeptide-like helical domain-containing protein [Artemisia annua]
MTHDQQQPLPPADECAKLLEAIKKQDFHFYKKNVVSYSTLFNRLISENRVHEAHGLFNKLIKDQLCQPDTALYNTIIKALCSFPILKNTALSTSMLDDALKLFKQMVSQQRISPDLVTYNSLISACCEHRRWRRATLLLHAMLDSSISPNVETFNSLVNAFCNERMIEQAYHVLYVMQEREILTALMLLAAAYGNLLEAYCVHIQMDDAMLLYHKMNKRGFKPNHATYDTMISRLFSVGRSGEAHKVLDDMRAQGQMLDKSTYLCILYDLGRKGRIEEALSLFHFIGDDHQLNSDNSAYNELICGAFKCKKPHLARELFEDLSVKGRKPDKQTYDTMIAGFCGEGLIKDAKQLFLKMEESGFLPIEDTYIFLLRGYLKSKCYDDVKTLLLKMSKTYYRLDALTYSWLQDPIADGSLDNT